jgi:asparagine synthase (glutamine-hydrolysing)
MVFNGEIYNFVAIRRVLEALGHHFTGTGDSEVIIAAFQQWGLEAVHRFIGMFAIALWDRREQRLSLLRDRLGVKPLYYGWDGTTLWFGSELKALRAFRHWQPEVDRAALAEYFQFGYVNAPRSIYRNVFKLPPGHWLGIDIKGEPKLHQYWSVLDAVADPLGASEHQLADELEALMIDAFRLRMVSDVPVGVFLSGGLDSSLLTAILQKHSGATIHTFTIGFKDRQINESHYAGEVARFLGTRHTDHVLETDEAMRILPIWGQIYDEPFADPSGIPTYLVSKIARNQVKVVLSADGGDELFSGYDLYTGMLERLRKREQLPAFARHGLAELMKRLPVNQLDVAAASLPLPHRLRRAIRGAVTRRACQVRDNLLAESNGEFYETAFSHWRAGEVTALIGCSDRVRETTDFYPGSFAEQMCLWDIHNYLPGDILTKVDRATMAVSIEGREPLLDHRIVEMAFRLPIDLRRGALGTKHLLRRVLYRHVPRAMVERPKMGFTVPMLEWLRGGLAHLLDAHLDPSDVARQGILNPGVVQRTLRAFRRGDDYLVDKVWLLLAFQLWRSEGHE